MEDNQELRDNFIKSATGAVGDLAYTVAFDVCNEIIAAGVDQETVLNAASTVVNRYVDGGIKVRKKPSPRAKTPKAPQKEKQVDMLTAASRKLKNLSSNMVWIVHPDSEEFSYTTSVKLATGYPVRNNLTHKVISVVNDDATVPLTMNDAKVALGLGLEIDYDSVQQP